MYTTEHQLRVRYGETDQMGYCYYGNYAEFYEVGRVEMLRSLGISYKSLEDRGILLPVLEYNIKYLKPAFYDDQLTIKTHLKELPKARIRFDYEIFNEKGEKLNFGFTTLVFVNAETGRPMPAPQDFLDKVGGYF